MSYNTCSHLKGDVAVSECFDGTGIEWQKGRKSMNAVASPSWCLHCLVVKKKVDGAAFCIYCGHEAHMVA